MKKTAFTLCIYAICCISCRPEALNADAGKVRLNLRIDAPWGVKSALASDIDAIEDGLLMIYGEDGVLLEQHDIGTDALELTLDRDRSYSFYAIANCPGFIVPQGEAQLKETRCNGGLFKDGRMILAGSLPSVMIEAGTSSLGIGMEHMACRVDMHLDRSALEHGMDFRVKSVEIKQANCELRPFASSSKAGVTADGDSLTEEQVKALNSGSVCCLYVPENMQGRVESITRETDKNPDKAPGIASTATYMEIQAAVSLSEYEVEDAPLTYRFFLGKNATSDFDIARNRVIELCFRPSASIYNRKEWKMTSTLIDPDYGGWIGSGGGGGSGSSEIIIEYGD